MTDKDDEEEERQRQRKENARLAPIDRFHKSPPHTAIDGGPDLRSGRRTGRVLQLNMHVTPRVRAIIVAILGRDKPPSLNVLLEEMVQAYLEKFGKLPEGLIPSDEELAERMEEEEYKRGKQGKKKGKRHDQ